MADLATIWGRVTRYADADDPLTSASNRLALILASNQPFYPLYVRWVTGEMNALFALTFLSTPFFVASPFVARKYPGIGRLWFPAVGAINTFFCAFVFGEASGVHFFLAPCLVIAALSCRAAERFPLAAYVAALLAAFILLHGRYGAPLFTPETAQLAALRSLNVYCAAILSVIAVWLLLPARSIAPVTR